MVEMDYSFAYLKMLLALGAIIGVLLLIKRYLQAKLPQTKSGIKILSQQMLDHKNRLSLVKYRDKEYLIVTGESGFLVDRYDSFEKDLKEEVENTNDY